MPEEPQDSEQNLWNRVLQAVQQTVPEDSFNTWFRPLSFVGCHDDTFELACPTDYFRSRLNDNFAALLEDILKRVVSPCCRLKISVSQDGTTEEKSVTLRVVRASELKADAETKLWLIERLWSTRAVGFICGPPKSLKTWTALEMAVSVASGTPCFGTFAVPRPGAVLLYAAEDPVGALRLRIESLARSHNLDLEQIDIRVIQADSLRLDRARDREKLAATVDLHRPVLLILDPLVRLHAVDENQAGPMAELLSHIRALQRSSAAAIAITHHARKNNAHLAGQSLRGSSDLYAFVDSLVSLKRRHGRVTLSAEHRSAPSLAPMTLELLTETLSLRIAAQSDTTPEDSLDDSIIKILSESHSASADSIRTIVRVRKQRVLEALRRLSDKGTIRRNGKLYSLAEGSETE